MLFNIILQHYSGCRQLTDNVGNRVEFKSLRVSARKNFLLQMLSIRRRLSIIRVYWYFLQHLHLLLQCSWYLRILFTNNFRVLAYAAFSIAEYM